MTALIKPANAQAYINHGRWIAECPNECGCARQLDPHETLFQCSECLAVLPIDWPDDADDLWDALMERPIPRTRNWFPDGHPLAARCGAPTGQSAQDLRDEQAEHERGV
jgi:hypothetical protein